MKNKQEHIDETILLRVLDNTADEKERNLFDSWVKESAVNAETFEQLKKVNQLTSIDTNSLNKNWESVVEKVKSDKEVPGYVELPGTAQPLSVQLNFNKLVRVAAMLVVLLGISFLLKIVVFGPEQQIVYGNDMDPKDPYQLADGSSVYLNKNAEISFSKKFGRKERKVSLKGEAFFEVARNENIPFFISTYNTTTLVLGTEFNIYSDRSGQVKVSVVSGVVEFYATKKSDRLRLTGGENGLYNPNLKSITKETINDPNFLAWKTGILYFTDTNLQEVFRLLEKQYSRVFVFEAKNSDMPTLTTTIDNMSMEAVLEELNLLLNTKNEIRNDTIIFKPNS